MEIITAWGNEKILATHESTIEITKESFLTHRGNCIIGINADKSCFDINDDMKSSLKREVKVKILLEANGKEDVVFAYGSPNLMLSSKTSIVIRKSDYIDDRTIAIKADKAAKDLKRELTDELKKTNAKLIVRIEVIE